MAFGKRDHLDLPPQEFPVLAAIIQLGILAAQQQGRMWFLTHQDQHQHLDFQGVDVGA